MPRGGRRATDRSGKHPTVLIADSGEPTRRACASYLQRFHFDVVEAADGESALALVAERSPRVILTEWMLPAMPAPRLLQWIAQSRTREIPVIVLANAIEPDAVACAPAAVLIKPFDLPEMLETVRRVLRRPPAPVATP